MSDRRTGIDRRTEVVPVKEERRVEERRKDERSRRQVMDRRVRSIPVEQDRRTSSRRNSDQDPTADNTPDWMEEALQQASERSAGFTPPPVDKKENEYFNMSDSEILKRQITWDSIIMGFVVICFIGLIATLFFGL